MRKFPLVRLKQVFYNPSYIYFWLRRLLFYKYTSYKYTDKYKNVNQLSAAETLDYIMDNDASLIRFGDGEFGLLSGAGIYPPDSDWSQRYSKSLKSEIERQLQLNHPKILLAIPPRSHLMYREGDVPALDVIPSMHTEARMYLWKFLRNDVVYGNCLVFLPQHNKNLNWEKISNYIQDKTIVVVTGGVDRLSDIHLGARTLFVECGKHNAFERRSSILNEINSLIEREELDPENTIFWISLGCTTGSLVEYLSGRDYMAWDTGHIFRFALAELNKL